MPEAGIRCRLTSARCAANHIVSTLLARLPFVRVLRPFVRRGAFSELNARILDYELQRFTVRIAPVLLDRNHAKLFGNQGVCGLERLYFRAIALDLLLQFTNTACQRFSIRLQNVIAGRRRKYRGSPRQDHESDHGEQRSFHGSKPARSG